MRIHYHRWRTHTFVFYCWRSVHAVLLVATTVSLHGTLVNDASLTLQPALALAHAPLRCPQHYSLLIIKLFIIIIIISVFLRHNFKKPQSLSMSYFNDSYRQLQPKQSSLCQTAVCSPKEALQRFVDQWDHAHCPDGATPPNNIPLSFDNIGEPFGKVKAKKAKI